MNLLSPIFEFTSTAESGTLYVYKSIDGGTTYNQLLFLLHLSGHSVWYPSKSYEVDLVNYLKVFSEYTIPLVVGTAVDSDFCIRYRAVFLPSGATTGITVATGVWYNSLEDSYSDRFITRKFVSGYRFPISYLSSKTIVVDGVTSTLSSSVGKCISILPIDSLSISGLSFTKVSSGLQLNYINSHGTWSVFVPEGSVYRSDSKSFDSANVYRSFNGIHKNKLQYNIKVHSQYTINSGWLNESQSAMLATDLLESPFIIMHNSDYPQGVLVTIDETSINYMDKHKDSVMNYEFKVNVASEIRR